MTNHIKRRKFLATLGSAAAWPVVARLLNLAVSFLARAANHALAGRGEADHDLVKIIHVVCEHGAHEDS